MMNSYMKKRISLFAQVNTSDLLRGVISDVNTVYQMMYHAFRVIAELFIAIAIVVYIMITDFSMAMVVVVLATLCVILVILGFRKPMRRYGMEYRK